MAKPIASQKLTTKTVKAPAEPAEPAEPAAPPTGSAAPRATGAGKTPTKVTEAETRPDDLPSSQRPPTGSTGEAAPTARIDAAFGKSDPATGGVSKVEERSGRPGEKPSAEDVLNDAQATIADARGGGRGDALAAGVPGVAEGRSGFGSLRDDAAQGDGTTGIAEQGKAGISTQPAGATAGSSPDLVDLTGTTVPFTGLLKDGAISKTEQFNLEQQARSADMAEAQRLAAEDAKTPPPAEEKKPPPPPAEGKASIPDEDRFDPNSTGGQVAEALRASTAPRGGGGDGATDPVDSGDLGTGGRTGLVPDQQDTLLGGDNRGGENVGGGGGSGAVPGPNTGTIDPVEGDDVGGGGGRESDPFADANQPGPDFDFNTPTSEDVDDDPAATFVLDQPRSAVVGRAAEGLTSADDDNDDLNEPD